MCEVINVDDSSYVKLDDIYAALERIQEHVVRQHQMECAMSFVWQLCAKNSGNEYRVQ